MKKITLSAVVLAYNAQDKLVDCLESLKFADELIVVDSSSTDNTVEIAKKYTKQVLTRPNHKMLNTNKNFGIDKATGEWILYLDDDEQVTPELASEIKKTISEKNAMDGYFIPRKNIIFGKWIEHTGWYPDYQMRLFKKGKGKFAEKHVHELLAVDGETAHLTEPMTHRNYQTVSQFLSKLDLYTGNEADVLSKNGYEFAWFDAIRMPTKEFISRFFAQEGYKDGLHGLVLSLLMAFYHLIVFARLWEKQKFVQVDHRDFLEEVAKEGKGFKKELVHWLVHEKLKQTKGLGKYSLKVKSKLSKIL